MNKKLLSLLGMARRAGRLSMGFDAASDSMKKGQSKLLVLAGDISQRTKNSIIAAARQTGTPAVSAGCTMDEIGSALGKGQTGIVSINDSGFAASVKALCDENSQEECI